MTTFNSTLPPALKIILADDHALFRGGFALLFKQLEAGAIVLEAGDLGEALALAAHHPDADLMLLDLNMPGMNGAAGIRRMAEVHPQLPVIVLSASETKESVHEVIAAGALGFIPKSSSSAVMQSAVRLVLSGGVYLPAQLIMTEQASAAGSPSHDEPVKLSGRQSDVLRLLAAGMSNKQICRELDIGEGTVKVHIAAIFRTLEVGNRTEAANAARRLGLID
jgi:DNA-binding NarL/FixJ family response regulator